MKRILINATHNEEIRVALCKGNHMYDFDLENRTREQKKANIYKAHVTRVEPSLEAVFVEYGAKRQGFLPVRNIAKEYLAGNPRNDNIRNLIKEGDTLIVQVEKEERGNKGAALSTYISLAGRYLVLMPNNPRGGGISRQISGKMREDMKRIVAGLQMPKGMSVIIRTAGIGKSQEDLQHDLTHLLNIWRAIGEQDRNYPSPRLVHQEAGVVTRAVRDYLRDDISEIWVDNENAYNEAAYFIQSVMPKQLDKLRKYTDYEPMFARFGIEKQIETAYQREVRLPSGGSIVIDQTEAMVAIDINSAKSTKGADVAETAYHTNLEAADEIARQLRLRDMGGLVVIDFIDMYDNQHQKEVEKRLVEATKYDRARIQFAGISKFGLMEMSRQRLRPSLEESTGYKCPRCHGTGMIRDLRSLSLSIMRQIEQLALTHRSGELQAEVPNDIAAFLLNEKRDSLVYLEQDSGTRITILPHAHLESPEYELHFNPEGFAPSSYERINDSEEEQTSSRGYDVNWQTADSERPKQQPTRKPREDNRATNNANSGDNNNTSNKSGKPNTAKQKAENQGNNGVNNSGVNNRANRQVETQAPVQSAQSVSSAPANTAQPNVQANPQSSPVQATTSNQPQAVAWLANLFAPIPQAQTVESISSQQAAEAIEAIVNNGGQSLGSFGQVSMPATATQTQAEAVANASNTADDKQASTEQKDNADSHANNNADNNRPQKRQQVRKPKHDKGRYKKDRRHQQNKYQKSERNGNSTNNTAQNNANNNQNERQYDKQDNRHKQTHDKVHANKERREPNSRRESRGEFPRNEALINQKANQSVNQSANQSLRPQANQAKATADLDNALDSSNAMNQANKVATTSKTDNANTAKSSKAKSSNEVTLQVKRVEAEPKVEQVVHLSLDKSKPVAPPPTRVKSAEPQPPIAKADDNKASESHAINNADNVGKADNLDKADNVNRASKAQATSSSAVEVAPVAKAELAEKVLKEVVEEQTTVKTETAKESTQVVTEVAMADVASSEALNSEATIEKPASVPTSRADGRAWNDPRVVREAMAKRLADQLATDKPTSQPTAPAKVTKAVAITGSVGEFLRAMLDNVEERLQNEGVIACFIDAVDKAKATQKDDEADKQSENQADKLEANTEIDFADFDFANYGYQPLTPNYLANFHAMVKSVAQFDVQQGKTSVEPTPIGKRADNDPRGQHPDYLAKLADSLDTQAMNQEPEVNSTVYHDEFADVFSRLLNGEAVAPVAPSNVDNTDVINNADEVANHDEAVMNHDNTDTAETPIVESASVIDDTPSTDDNEVSGETVVAEITAEENVTDNAEEVYEQIIDELVIAEQTEEVEATEQADEESVSDEQKERAKTTFDKYKSMLANVSEQLSTTQQPTGINSLFLSSPVIPKARSRKK